MEPQDELLTLARNGIDAEVFMASPLGRFVRKRAEDEEATALAELIAADPEDAKLNRELRNRIHVVRMAISWMRTSIDVGSAAHQQLREIEEIGRHE